MVLKSKSWEEQNCIECMYANEPFTMKQKRKKKHDNNTRIEQHSSYDFFCWSSFSLLLQSLVSVESQEIFAYLCNKVLSTTLSIPNFIWAQTSTMFNFWIVHNFSWWTIKKMNEIFFMNEWCKNINKFKQHVEILNWTIKDWLAHYFCLSFKIWQHRNKCKN